MDPLTHAASGAVAMLACQRRPMTAWAVPLAALAAASPDIDIAFAPTPLDFLLLHRGITHSLAAVPLLALLLAVLCCPLWRSATPGRWSFGRVWLFSCLMLLLHIWLDIITTYGTMIFLPFSHERVRLNAVFIVDVLLTLPLLWAIWRWRARRRLLVLCLVWIFLYPSAAIGLNHWHSAQNTARLAEEGREVQSLTVLPDALSPFYWRLLYAEADSVAEQSLNALGQPRGAAVARPAAEPGMLTALAAQSVRCKAFFAFALLPVTAPLPPDDAPVPTAPDTAGELRAGGKDNSTRLCLYYDLRFGSGLPWVRWLMAQRPNADIPFRLMAETQGKSLLQERLRFSDSGRDSGWQPPRKPSAPDWASWLMGLY